MRQFFYWIISKAEKTAAGKVVVVLAFFALLSFWTHGIIKDPTILRLILKILLMLSIAWIVIVFVALAAIYFRGKRNGK